MKQATATPCAGCGLVVHNGESRYKPAGNHGATLKDGRFVCVGCSLRLIGVTAQRLINATEPAGAP